MASHDRVAQLTEGHQVRASQPGPNVSPLWTVPPVSQTQTSPIVVLVVPVLGCEQQHGQICWSRLEESYCDGG